LPVGVGDDLATAARAFLRDHLMSNELAAFRAQWRFGDNGMANNAGCGSGLEWVQCRYCGLADAESGPKHLGTGAKKKLHEAHKRRYDERTGADASAAESRRKASRALQKVLRNPGKQHSGNTHLAIQQVLAQAPVTYEPSVSTAASVAAGARGGGGGSSGGSSSGTSSSSGSSGGDSFNTAEERYRASLQQPRARTAQQRRVTEVSDASGGEEVAAAEFKVPEPKTRGQKRKSEDAQGETTSSVSGYDDEDWANMRRGNTQGCNRDEVVTEWNKNDPDAMNYFDERAWALQIEEAGYEVPSAETVSQVAQGIARGDIQRDDIDDGSQGVVMSALMHAS
jgi:hypothetical protein